MMTIHDFVDAILTLNTQFDFSVTSWIRTSRRNREVGGNAESYHLCGLGIDCILDVPTSKESLIRRARKLGLDAVDEGDHVHLEPSG